MKYKILLVAFGMLSLVSCKTVKKNSEKDSGTNDKKELVRSDKKEEIFFTEQTRNDFRAVSESAQQKFLEAYNATDKQYSILFFTQGFNGENVVVKNDNTTLYKGSILTNKKTGLAKNMRIVNTDKTSILDKATQKTIYINAEKAHKHKFIYVMKGDVNDDKPYKITFSDKLRPEK
ncbi:hypothetical protein NU10_02140 [Flavobacterium dauae]|uniref:hypothetical protein n=1 Tax=Flavobacterium dauae TaxID=1563479 RepID=UPI00101B3768|nr:hypothetical protein [Flavobacterium dauae]WLD24221.1 hypothetical protein NU10_02140 [Flavobacterium dauae]